MQWSRIRVLVATGVGCAALVACSPSADKLLADGRAAMQSGDLPAALVNLKAAAQAAPTRVDVREALASALLQAGDIEGLEEQLRRQLAFGGSATVLVPQIAAWQNDRGDTARLIREWSSVTLDDAASNATLRAQLAIAHLQQGRTLEAARLLAGLPNDLPAVAFATAQLALRQGKTEQAKTSLRALRAGLAQSTDSQSWWMWRGLARFERLFGQPELALAAMKRAVTALPEHFALQGEYAEWLIEAQQIDQAREIHASLKRRAPGYFRTGLVGAALSLHDGQVDQAHALAEKVLAAVPDNVSAALIASSIDLQRGALETARARLDRTLQRSPKHPGALRMMGQIAMRAGQFDRADGYFEQALREDPLNSSLIADRAAVLLMTGRPDEAASQLRRLPQDAAPSPSVELMQAQIALRRNEREAAIKAVTRVAAAPTLDPATALSGLRLALRLGQPTIAQQIVQSAITARPRDPEPLLWKAIVAKEQGDLVQARQLLLQALDLSAGFFPALQLLEASSVDAAQRSEYAQRLKAAADRKAFGDARVAAALMNLRRAEGASPAEVADAASKLVEQMPDSIAMRDLAAQWALRAGNERAATKVIDEGLAAYPKAPSMLELAAVWAERTGRRGVAIERYETLLKAGPEPLTLLVRLAQLQTAEREFEKAAALYEKALKASPGNRDVLRDLAQLYVRKGQLPEALAVVDRPDGIPGTAGILLKADLHYLAKDLGGARKLYEQALRQDPTDATFSAQTRFFDAIGESRDADRTIEQWLQKWPKSPVALQMAATRAMRANAYDKALGPMQRLVAIQPENPYLLNDLAWVQSSLGRAEAIQAAQRAAQALPENPMVLDTLAQAHIVRGELDQAARVAEQVLLLSDGAPAGKLRLAEILQRQNKLELARKQLSLVEEGKLDPQQVVRARALRKTLEL